jgi:hypothetical protein
MSISSNSRPATKVAVPALRYFAAVLGIVAGLIHFAVTPEHFEEAFEFGAFMTVVGIFQVVSSVMLMVRPSRLLVVVIIVFNALVAATYAIAYTVGLPFGPKPGEPEQVNGPGSAATIGELVLLVVLLGVLVALLRRGGFRQPPGTNPV